MGSGAETGFRLVPEGFHLVPEGYRLVPDEGPVLGKRKLTSDAGNPSTKFQYVSDDSGKIVGKKPGTLRAATASTVGYGPGPAPKLTSTPTPKLSKAARKKIEAESLKTLAKVLPTSPHFYQD